MADRTRYLIAYDIRDPKRLRRVHKVAKDYGYPLQYSLFVCDLSRVELLEMKGDLMDEANLRVDSIGIFDLGQPTGRGVECVEFLGSRADVPDDGEPAIW